MSEMGDKLHPCKTCGVEPCVTVVMGESCRIFCPQCFDGVMSVHYGEARARWQRYNRRLMGLWADVEEVTE